MKKETTYTHSDEELLQQFFVTHSEPIEDDGFTERVMAAVQAQQDEELVEALRLRRWSCALNVVGVLAGIILLTVLGFFPRMWSYLVELPVRWVSFVLSYDWDNLLVQLLLHLHQLPEMLPSATQLAGFFMVTVLLSVLTAQQLVRREV